MKRYSEQRIDNVVGRGKVYDISFPDTFAEQQQIYMTYTPTETERLDNIAYKFYGDSTKWYVIARANKAVTGKFYADRGQSLVIPNIEL